MLEVYMRAQFKRDYKRVLQQKGHSPAQLETVLEYLINEKPLPQKYQDHKLSGKYHDFRECHIAPDWLLIYKVKHQTLTLVLTRTGSHSDLF